MSNTVLPLIPLRPALPPAPPCGAPAVPELPPRDALASAVRELKSRLDAIAVAKADLVNGKVPAGQLPSYVDDVVEVAELPQSGESGKLYVVTGTNAVYRWSGSSFVEVSPSRDWSGELAAKRGLTDFSVGDGWLLVKPGGAPVWMASRGDSDIWVGDDELEPSLTRDSGPLGEAWIFGIGPQASGERARLEIPYSEVPVDSAVIVVNVEASAYFDGVYRLVRGSRLALDTEIPLADSAVTRTSANPVKSSGIWSAIWGALTELPTGFTALYDWVVAQLADKVPTSREVNGKALSGDVALTAADVGALPITGGTITGPLQIPNITFASVNKVFRIAEFLGRLAISNMTDTILVFIPNVTNGTLALAAPNPTAGNLAALDANGNTTDSGTKPSDFASAADLRYLILGAIYNARDDFYILADRTVNLITAEDETSIDIELPAAVTVGAVRYARDFFLDVDNSANASDLALEFTGLGVDYAFVPLEDDSISEMMTIGAGERVRLYFTETPYTATGSLPVINVARVTLGDFVTSTATQGGN